MIRVSSGRAIDPEGHVNARWRFVAAAILMLAGGFNIISGAYAQTNQDAASCTEKCKADEQKCLTDQGSEEMCDYDSKMCKKACGDNK